MVGQIVQAQRLRVFDQDAEDAVAAGQWADLLDGLVVDPDGDELRQRIAFADHAERAVSRIDEPDAGFDDALQHGLKVEVGSDRQHRVEKSVHAVTGGDDCLQPSLQLGEQFVELKLSAERLPTVRRGFVRLGHAPILP